MNSVFVKIQLTMCHVNIRDYSSHTNYMSLMRVIQLKVKCTSALIYLICHFPFSSDTCDSVSIPAVNLLDNRHGFTVKVAFSTQVTYMTLQHLRTCLFNLTAESKNPQLEIYNVREHNSIKHHHLYDLP